MRMTLREISARTGLSVSVLSRVASGNGYVSADKRKQAEEALRQYRYSRVLPKSVNEGLMQDIVLVIAGATGNTYQQIISELTLCAHKANRKVLTAHTHYDEAFEAEYLRFAQRVDAYGVVMLSVPESRSMARLLRESRTPIVLVGRYSSMIATDVVSQDSYEMGMLAARKLLRAGHTRVGYLGGHVESSITRDKQQGFVDALKDAGLSLKPEWTLYGELNYASGMISAQQLLEMDDAPTALFVSNDLMAMGLIDRLTAAGRHIPQDLSIICCDKTLSSDTYRIPLDRLYIDWGQTASTVFRLLKAQREEHDLLHRVVLFETEYAEGASIAAPRKKSALR